MINRIIDMPKAVSIPKSDLNITAVAFEVHQRPLNPLKLFHNRK
jgi:hypothetical protein